MKSRFRLFRRRGSVFYCFDNTTNRYTSLGTKDRQEADQLVRAKNQAVCQPAFNRQMGKMYLAQSDPSIATRTWRAALEELMGTKRGPTSDRWVRAGKDRAFVPLLGMVIIETQAEHFLRVLRAGTVSTNVHLRKLHNFCLDMNWLLWPVIPKRQWPEIKFKEKRAITLDEHRRIVQGERNPERRAFYELAWHVGGAQSDLAALRAEDIDWEHRAIRYFRKKTRNISVMRFSEEVAGILRSLPPVGLLFPAFGQLRETHRATEFKRACKRAGVNGVTLHCYRYSWAERAKTCGYPERFAQSALGHNSRAVHEAYAGGAVPVCPPPDEYETAYNAKIVPLKPNQACG